MIPALTTEQMAEVDRLMIEDYGILLIQMMENAGRNLAEQVGKLVINTLWEYAPDFGQCIQQYKVITPLDMEKVYNLPEGNPDHGEMTLNQFMWMQPIPRYAQYRAPVDGLYLCSAATHPGGGVTGISGRNASRQVLRDLK